MLAVSTGLDSFLNPQDIGPMYPFEGTEVAFAALAFFLWLGWHFLQARGESAENRDAVALYDAVGLERAMRHQTVLPDTGDRAPKAPAEPGDSGTSVTGAI